MRPRAVRAARGISRHSPRAETLDTASPTRQTDAAEAEAGSEHAACPYTAAKSMMSSLRSPPASPANGEDFPVYPGPGADVLRNIADVMYIGIKGMERATLYFADSYGPIARFPNPISLGDAAGWVFLNNAELIEHCCRTNTANYTERFLPDVYAYVTKGKGILGSGGQYNKQQRKMCMPFFQTAPILERYSQVVVDRSAQLSAIWQEEGQWLQADVAVQMQRLTLDIVGMVAFSHNFGQVDAMQKLGATAGENEIPTDRILHDINVAQDSMGKVFVTPLPLLELMSKLKVPVMTRMEESFADMKTAMMPVIHERREALARGDERKGDLLEVLLDAQAENRANNLPPLSDAELWENVHDVMGAGHETTASTLTAALYSVAAHPQVDARVAAELAQVLGVGEEARTPTYEDMSRLPYCEQVIKEVLRLYPPIPIFPRVAAGDDVLPSGHQVVKNDVIFMSAYAMGRSDTVWDSPMTFDPERFAPAAEEAMHKFAWVPFGAGPRMCMGGNFAMLSTTLAFATLMSKHRFSAVKDRGAVFPIEYDITMHFPGAVEMNISRR